MYTDAHIHLYDCFVQSGIEPDSGGQNLLCASSCRPDEFLWQESYAASRPGRIFLSFGIHPQDPDESRLEFLAELVRDRRVQAIGECGFDFYEERFSARKDEQKRAWDAQVSLATDSGLPLVVHCRKGLPLIFADFRRLKKISAVVFHGWPGSANEARSLLSRGINAYFSIGKALLRGDRSAAETVAALPLDRILTETDAPYMTLRGEKSTQPADIEAVARAAAVIAGTDLSTFVSRIKTNFTTVFRFP